MPPKLTVIIPCLNESQNLADCVASVRELADEIIVADSGSTDGTQAIAESLGGVKLIEGEWLGYGAFKNWAIPQAANAWVMILDADERATPELATEVRETLASAPDDVDGFWIGFRPFFLGHELRYASYNTAALRLFRRDRCRYSARRVHEEIEIEPQRSGRLRNRLLHYSIWSYDQYFEKYLKYTRIGAQELAARGRKATFLSLSVRPFLRFFSIYVLRRGFLDGLPGLQICMLTAFFNTFVKQARLWEMQQAGPQKASGENETPSACANGPANERANDGQANDEQVDGEQRAA